MASAPPTIRKGSGREADISAYLDAMEKRQTEILIQRHNVDDTNVCRGYIRAIREFRAALL